ncbi:MAG: hypothetical protein BWY44_01193 [Candidatus Omnitrophica bacterium ADurb.Bin292]|nr:MAG: hypothetical protein BWY44_01193 [Candidatus Omnitrophica bacterium ADurb.Bin292]
MNKEFKLLLPLIRIRRFIFGQRPDFKVIAADKCVIDQYNGACHASLSQNIFFLFIRQIITIFRKTGFQISVRGFCGIHLFLAILNAPFDKNVSQRHLHLSDIFRRNRNNLPPAWILQYLFG